MTTTIASERRVSPRSVAALLKGLPCWNVGCGGSVGYSFSLSFGRKMLRSNPLRNPAASEEFRKYGGEFQLIVWCPWRLEIKGQPIASSDSTETEIVEALKQLEGKKVRSVRVDAPAWDMRLSFTKGIVLHVFCEYMGKEPTFGANWDLSTPSFILSVLPGGGWEVEKTSRRTGRATSRKERGKTTEKPH